MNDRAVRDLRYIRETMERAGSFTAVPGWGGVLMGATAIVTAYFTRNIESREVWFIAWMAEAVLAAAVGVLAMLRLRQLPESIKCAHGRR